MRRGLFRSFGVPLLTVVVVFAVTSGVGRLLAARGPIAILSVVFGLYAGVNAANSTSVLVRWLRTVAGILLLTLSFVWIVIVPLAAYEAWFAAVADLQAHGSVSTVIAILAGIGIAHLAALIRERPWLFLLSSLTWVGFLAAVTIQEPVALVGVVVAGLLTLTVGVASGVRQGLQHMCVLGIISLLSVSFALGVSPHLAPTGSRLIDERLSPALRSAVVAVWPEFPLLAQISGYGEGFRERDLFGAPVLTEAVLFEVEGHAGRTMYLRESYFDTYENGRWSVAPHSPPRADEFTSPRADEFTSPLADEFEDRIGASDSVEDEAGRTMFSRWDTVSQEAHSQDRLEAIRLTVETDFLVRLPYPVATVFFTIPGTTASTTPSGETGVLVQPPLSRGDVGVFHVSASRDSPYSAGVHGDKQRFTRLPRVLESEPLMPFIAVPDPNGEVDVTAAVRSIVEFLAEGSRYTLRPEPPPRGVDPVVHFLTADRSGYCVYFATAAVILARRHDIPARYATGYIVPPEASDRPALVRGLHAHAWAEVLVEGQWRILEATPAVSRLTDPSAPLPDSFVGTGITRRQIDALGLPLEHLDESQRIYDIGTGRLVGGLLGILVAGGVIGAFVFLRRESDDRRFPKYSTLSNSRWAGVSHAGRIPCRFERELRRLVRRSGLPSPPNRVGWSGWAASATVYRRHFDRVATIASRSYFGARMLRERDIRFVRALHRRFRARRLRRRLRVQRIKGS